MFGILDLLKQMSAAGAGLTGGVPELPTGGMTPNGQAGPLDRGGGMPAVPDGRMSAPMPMVGALPSTGGDSFGRMYGPGSTVNEMNRRFNDMQTRHVLKHPSDYRPLFERQQEQDMQELLQQMKQMQNQWRGWDI